MRRSWDLRPQRCQKWSMASWAQRGTRLSWDPQPELQEEVDGVADAALHEAALGLTAVALHDGCLLYTSPSPRD
eukprot:8670402-Alexandrium_andersonii.AAC.1